jgi:hypothetical protein
MVIKKPYLMLLLPLDCTEHAIYVFPEMKLRGLVPNSYIHVFVSHSDLCIPRNGLHLWLQQNRQTDPGNIEISHRYNVENRRQNIIILFWNNEAAQFHF